MTAPKYDVFLSHKNLVDGVETADARLARDIYHFLSAKGLRVFLSAISLQQQGQAAFQRAIDDALDSADVLVAIGTSKENLESRWVRKEWEGFENDIASDIKPHGRIFSYVADLKVNSLPRTLRNYQVIFHNPHNATMSLSELYNFIAGKAAAGPPPIEPPPTASPVAEAAPLEEDEVIAKWTEAGADFDPSQFCFRFDEIQPGVMENLPPPDRRFALHLYGPSVTAEILKELRPLKNLQTLRLYGPQVTDAGLKKLTGLKNLEGLILTDTPITGAGLKDLAKLKNLERLELDRTQVGDVGMKELAGLKKLRTLCLIGTRLSDAGLKELAGLKSLQTLDLSNTQVTDAGLKELAQLEGLQDLNISLTQVTDAGVAELAGAQNLRALNVAGTKVTEAGLQKLAGRNRFHLYVGSTQIGSAAEAELRRLCPGLTIFHIPLAVLSRNHARQLEPTKTGS